MEAKRKQLGYMCLLVPFSSLSLKVQFKLRSQYNEARSAWGWMAANYITNSCFRLSIHSMHSAPPLPHSLSIHFTPFSRKFYAKFMCTMYCYNILTYSNNYPSQAMNWTKRKLGVQWNLCGGWIGERNLFLFHEWIEWNKNEWKRVGAAQLHLNFNFMHEMKIEMKPAGEASELLK